jgi:hypothetical protein
MKAMRLVITSNGVPYLQRSLVGSHRTSENGKEVKDGRLTDSAYRATKRVN